MVAYSFKRRFVDPIRVGLGLAIPTDLQVPEGYRLGPVLTLAPRPKRQTIRAIGKRRHARPGETLQLYHGMRTAQCFKIGEARCISVEEIWLTYSKIEIAPGTVDHFEIRTLALLNAFARKDGFEDWKSMQQFWREEHGDEFIKRPFVGVLIKWGPMQ